MDTVKNFDNYDFIKTDELKLLPDTKIVILYARFMHSADLNWTFETHSHSFYELHFPLCGSCGITLKNSQAETVDTGNQLLIYPHTNHKFTYFSDNFFRLSIAFDIQFNEKFLSDKDNYIIDPTGTITKQLINHIINEYNARRLGYKNILNFGIQEIMIEFFRAYPELFSGNKKQSHTKENVVNTAIKFIKNNISLNINAESVAQSINLSSRQLNRIFTLNFNMTVSEFIRNERIIRVTEHLKKTNLPLHEIAMLTGFNDEYVLCKAFKKITGITPGKYRLEYKKKEGK